jgi:hypothetical protein
MMLRILMFLMFLGTIAFLLRAAYLSAGSQRLFVEICVGIIILTVIVKQLVSYFRKLSGVGADKSNA